MENSEAKKVLNLNTINQNILQVKYAIFGLIPTKADEISRELKRTPEKYPFDEVLYCNIGNPQAVGQKPITWYRDILSLINAPHFLDNEEILKSFNKDVVNRTKAILKCLPNGMGGYSKSLGNCIIKQKVMNFIQNRDDGFEANPENIILTNGASEGIELLLTSIISEPNVGVFIPVPQYPVYSAFIRLLNGKEIPYFLKEKQNWSVDIADLQRDYDASKVQNVKPRAFVLINPGNPTGNVFTKSKLLEIIKFCHKNSLILLADEVYQENIYSASKEFHSVKKLVYTLGSEYSKSFEFVSFHSTSKGVLGECGRRGGYLEICNFDKKVLNQIKKLQSTKICPNVTGQVMVSLMCEPPKPDEDSYEQYKAEKEEIFNSLKRKSVFLFEKFNSMKGIVCQPIEGAMYAFPEIKMPEKAKVAAEERGIQVDELYCLSLLEATGICCVPGSGFGQEVGTHHIRITFLPGEEKLKKAMVAFEEHHDTFMTKYSTEQEEQEEKTFPMSAKKRKQFVSLNQTKRRAKLAA